MHLTPKAIKKAKEELFKQGKTYIRIGVKAGGCSGYKTVILWSSLLKTDDHILEFDGLRVVVDPKSMPYLDSVVLDYESKNLLDFGFKFVYNDSDIVDKVCGCGESYTLKSK